MNKKASLHIGILVLLVLFTSLLALYTFATSSYSGEIDASDIRSLDELFAQKNNLEFHFSQVVESVFVKTFNEFSELGLYLDPNFRGIRIFDSLNSNLEIEFLRKFNSNLEIEFADLNLSEQEIILLKEKVSQKNYESKLYFESGQIIVIIDNIELSLQKGLNAKYLFSLEEKFEFNLVGLDFFDDIFEAVQKCESEGEFESCMNNELDFFEASIKETSDGDVLLVELTSKNYFIIDDILRKVKFGFYVFKS